MEFDFKQFHQSLYFVYGEVFQCL